MARNPIKSFIGGLAFTLVLVLAVPVICTKYIHPIILEHFSGSVAFLSSMTLDAVVMLIITLVFTIVLGGGMILRGFGIFGVLGLITGYYIIGRPQDAIVPVGLLIAITCILYVRRKKKEKTQAEEKEEEALARLPGK